MPPLIGRENYPREPRLIMPRTDHQKTRQVDLSTCDREPIHIPGSIQPHGVLLVLDEPSYEVRQASQNVGEMLGIPVEQVLGRTLDEILSGEQVERLRQGVQERTRERRSLLLRTINVEVDGQHVAFQSIAHRNGAVLILELEPLAGDEAASFHDIYPLIRDFLARLESV